MNIFNEALEMHALWKINLKKNIDEGIFQDINKIGDCHACDLGRWIYKEGVCYNHLPSFELMCIAHEHFHRMAAEVIYHSNAKNIIKARSLLTIDGEFSQSSSKLIRALMDCSKELSYSVDFGISNRHKVRDILQNKNNKNIIFVDCNTSALEAIRIMVDYNIGSLVVNQDLNFYGIFTERGYLQHIVHKGECCLKMPVSEMIDIGIFCVDPDDSILQCMILMTTNHLRHLPVLEQGKLVGIISLGDVVKKAVSDDNDTISQLEGYIHGSYGAQ